MNVTIWSEIKQVSMLNYKLYYFDFVETFDKIEKIVC